MGVDLNDRWQREVEPQMAQDPSMSMDGLGRYDRATVTLWTRSYTQLIDRTAQRPLAEAAMHALLSWLRAQTTPASLLARYEVDSAADFVLIGSLLPGNSWDEQWWQARDGAFYLRWRELTGGPR